MIQIKEEGQMSRNQSEPNLKIKKQPFLNLDSEDENSTSLMMANEKRRASSSIPGTRF